MGAKTHFRFGRNSPGKEMRGTARYDCAFSALAHHGRSNYIRTYYHLFGIKNIVYYL